VYTIATKLQLVRDIFRDKQHRQTSGNIVRRRGVLEIENGVNKPEVENRNGITSICINCGGGKLAQAAKDGK